MAVTLGTIGSPGAVNTFAASLELRLREKEWVVGTPVVTSNHASVVIDQITVNYVLVYDGEIQMRPGKGVLFRVTTAAVSNSTVEIDIIYATNLGHIDRVKACLEIVPWILCAEE